MNWPAIDDVDGPNQACEFSISFACEQQRKHRKNNVISIQEYCLQPVARVTIPDRIECNIYLRVSLLQALAD